MLLLLEFGASWEARNKEKEMPNDCAQNSAIQTVFKDFIFRTRDSEDYLYATNHDKKVSCILINHIFTPLIRVTIIQFLIPIFGILLLFFLKNISYVFSRKILEIFSFCSKIICHHFNILFDSFLKTHHSLKRSSTFSSPIGFRRSNNVFRTTTALHIKKNYSVERELTLVLDAIASGNENLVREMMGWEKKLLECSIETESSCDVSGSSGSGPCHPLCKCRKCSSQQVTETRLNVAMASKSGACKFIWNTFQVYCSSIL